LTISGTVICGRKGIGNLLDLDAYSRILGVGFEERQIGDTECVQPVDDGTECLALVAVVDAVETTGWRQPDADMRRVPGLDHRLRRLDHQPRAFSAVPP
jgi:hypothetical protein